MEISMRMLGGVDVVEAAGSATVETPDRLRNAFLQAIERGRKRFILNLSQVTVIDSMTIGELVACFKRARERGGDVKLVVVPDGIIHELIQLTGLDRVFQIYGDEGEAASSFNTAPS